MENTNITKAPKFTGILLSVLGLVYLVGNLICADFLCVTAGFVLITSGIFIALGKIIGIYAYSLFVVLVIVADLIRYGTVPLPTIALPVLIGIYLFSKKIRGNLK